MVKFNFSVMKTGVGANRKDCPGFDVQEGKDFPCLSPGSNALSAVYAAISVATSLMIVGILRKESLTLLLVLSGMVFALVLGGVVSKDLYTMEEKHKKLGPHIGRLANLAALMLAVLMAYMVLEVPYPVKPT